MAVHRPLSPWVARVAGTLGPVNDGDDRADARHMGSFGEGWTRAPVAADGAVALGLLRIRDGTTVVELDDFGTPITCTAAAVSTISRIEENWPVLDPGSLTALPALITEPLPLRYWLMERLDAEGDPPDAAFAILPWDLLDRATEEIARAFDEGGLIGELVEIRHWLSPAVTGIAGPLELLDQGLRTRDDDVARRGATALLRNLRDLPLSRIPAGTRVKLHDFVVRVGSGLPELGDLAVAAAARLAAGGTSVPDLPGPLWLVRVAELETLGVPDDGQPAGALDFTASPVPLLGPDVRGRIVVGVDHLEVSLTQFGTMQADLTVQTDEPGTTPVQFVSDGRRLVALLPWHGLGLPTRLIFRTAPDS